MLNEKISEILKILEKLENIDDKYKKNVAEFCDNILANNSSQIISIFLYGEKNNVLFVLKDEANCDFFYTTSKIVQKFNKKNIISLFMTQKHIETSQDVFPLEFLDIKNSGKLIYGDDIFADIHINLENLRLQLEQQLKGLLIRFYQILLEVGDDKKKVRDMVNNSMAVIFAVFRGMIILKQGEYLVDKNLILDKIEKDFGIDLQTIKLVLIKTSKNECYDKEIMNAFIKQLQDIAYLVDGVKLC